MRRAIHPIAAALAAIALAAPLATSLAAATHEEFETAIKTTLAPLAGKSIAGLKVLYLSNDVGPWLDTGLDVKAGERITTIVQGRIVWSKALDITISPAFAVWARIGDQGSIFRGTRDTNTITASGDGKLYLKALPGRWLDKTGRYDSDPAPVNPDWGGGASVAIIEWAQGADIETELKNLADAPGAPSWASAELDRLKTTVLPPKGWSYLWDLGPSETFKEIAGSPGDKGPERRIALRTLNDAAILHRDAETELTP